MSKCVETLGRLLPEINMKKLILLKIYLECREEYVFKYKRTCAHLPWLGKLTSV